MAEKHKYIVTIVVETDRRATKKAIRGAFEAHLEYDGGPHFYDLQGDLEFHQFTKARVRSVDID